MEHEKCLEKMLNLSPLYYVYHANQKKKARLFSKVCNDRALFVRTEGVHMEFASCVLQDIDPLRPLPKKQGHQQ